MLYCPNFTGFLTMTVFFKPKPQQPFAILSKFQRFNITKSKAWPQTLTPLPFTTVPYFQLPTVQLHLDTLPLVSNGEHSFTSVLRIKSFSNIKNLTTRCQQKQLSRELQWFNSRQKQQMHWQKLAKPAFSELWTPTGSWQQPALFPKKKSCVCQRALRYSNSLVLSPALQMGSGVKDSSSRSQSRYPVSEGIKQILHSKN